MVLQFFTVFRVQLVIGCHTNLGAGEGGSPVFTWVTVTSWNFNSHILFPYESHSNSHFHSHCIRFACIHFEAINSFQLQIVTAASTATTFRTFLIPASSASISPCTICFACHCSIHSFTMNLRTRGQCGCCGVWCLTRTNGNHSLKGYCNLRYFTYVTGNYYFATAGALSFNHPFDSVFLDAPSQSPFCELFLKRFVKPLSPNPYLRSVASLRRAVTPTASWASNIRSVGGEPWLATWCQKNLQMSRHVNEQRGHWLTITTSDGNTCITECDNQQSKIPHPSYATVTHHEQFSQITEISSIICYVVMLGYCNLAGQSQLCCHSDTVWPQPTLVSAFPAVLQILSGVAGFGFGISNYCSGRTILSAWRCGPCLPCTSRNSWAWRLACACKDTWTPASLSFCICRRTRCWRGALPWLRRCCCAFWGLCAWYRWGPTAWRASSRSMQRPQYK